MCPIMIGRRNAVGVMTALLCVEMGLDSEDDAPATMQPSNAELIQALVLLPSTYSDRMIPAKMEADVTVRK